MSLTSQIRYVRVLDSTATDGRGKTGIAFGSFAAKLLAQGGTLVTLTTEDIATLGTFQAPTSAAHIRIKELDNTDPTKGIYEIHFHNDQLATGAKLWLFLSASGAACIPLEIELGDSGGGGGDYPTVEEIVAGITASGTPIQVTNGSNIAADGDELRLVQGEAYLASIDNAIEITIVDPRLPEDLDENGSLVFLRISASRGTAGGALGLPGSVATWNGETRTAVVRFDMTAAQSASMPAGERKCIYEVDWHIAGASDDVITSIAESPCTFRRHIG